MYNFFYNIYGVVGSYLKPLEDLFRASKSKTLTTLPGLTLYHFQISYYSFRVRNVLQELGIQMPMIDVLVNRQAFDEMMKNAGKDQVPCLKIESENGVQWMYESDDIIAYLKKRVSEVKK